MRTASGMRKEKGGHELNIVKMSIVKEDLDCDRMCGQEQKVKKGPY